MISIRRINLGEGLLFRDIRLQAMQESPKAFGSSYESAIERSTESWHEQADKSATGSDRATFFLLDNDRPAGLIAFYGDDNVSIQGEIIQLWVAPHLRGTGAGMKLITVALKWAQDNGFTRAIADVFEDNNPSLGLFQKLGFSVTDEVEFKQDGHVFLIKGLVTE